MWLSGPMCFCDTRAALPALLLVDYILIFYQEHGVVVRDIVFTEGQLSIAAQAFGRLNSFHSSSMKSQNFLCPNFLLVFFFLPLSFLKTEKCLRNALALSLPDWLPQ